MKKLLFGLILLLPFTRVNAMYCRYDDLAYLKKLAANINYTYSYVENNGTVSFSVTLTNLQSNLYVVDLTKNSTYTYKDTEMTIDNYEGGQVVKYNIYTNAGECTDQILYTIVFTLPTYNPFYNDELCKDIPDYELCQKWSTHKLDYQGFKTNVKNYLSTLNNSDEEKKLEETKELQYSKVLKFLSENYYIPLVVIIISIGVWMYIYNKKSNIYN